MLSASSVFVNICRTGCFFVRHMVESLNELSVYAFRRNNFLFKSSCFLYYLAPKRICHVNFWFFVYINVVFN